jgi:chemotaxis protein methyltransferase CheR
MTLSRASGASSPVSVPEAVPRLLRDLVHEHTGIYFESDRLDAMIEKLQPRAAHNRCTSFLDYYYLLKYDQAGPEEWRRVMDVFSVQETYFWREYDQIRALVDEVVPRWFRATDRPLRIWSAACASGEEPYSIAMALEEAGWGQHPIELHASDASESALQKAQAAVYRERSFRSLPPPLRSKYFRASPEGDRLSSRNHLPRAVPLGQPGAARRLCRSPGRARDLLPQRLHLLSPPTPSARWPVTFRNGCRRAAISSLAPPNRC